MEQLFGYIERITFQNQESGFTVARLKIPNKQELTTIVGTFPPIQPGEKVRCLGTWKQNPAHGMQFEVKECTVDAPSDLLGIQKYLSSGLIAGIGPAYAKRIIKAFGLQTLEIIDKEPEKLFSVDGLGKKRVEKIQHSWANQKSIRNIMIFLQRYAISPAYAHKIFKYYGEQSIEKLEENPYELAKNISGIGFKMADAIAERMGITKEADKRIDSGIEFVLSELSSEGHVCYPLDPFTKKAEELLQVEAAKILERIDATVDANRTVKDNLEEWQRVEQEPFIWLKGLYLSENGIAKELSRLKKHACSLRAVDAAKAADWVEQKLHLKLADHQKEAVKKSIQEKLHIITGGPGTGKSTITKAILAITTQLTSKILLAAPTGRAAKRMSEITKHMAFTIHSLLKYDFAKGGFRHNRDNPLSCDCIIIDESSMIDTSLMYHLLKAIPNHARVIFVGDICQLPSVGPGNVLKDMIESDQIAVSTLSKIFRQAAGSKIITNAHRINEGRFPDVKSDEKSDFFYIQKESPSEVLKEILDLVSTRLKKKYGFDPIDDIQVLAPLKKGPIGTIALNSALQNALNPQNEYFMHGGYRFAVHDKVMQIRNNYKKEVYNGDIGKIKSIDKDEQHMLIDFDGKEVVYPFADFDDLSLAYATSIHKYQGSECPCVVIPIHSSHFILLHRNLLYTGVTRGKKLVVLVGQMKAIAMAVSNDDVKKRFTGLKYFIVRKFREAS